jgi:predicted glycosyltransferase involved in capsule biosynthesis
MTLELRPQQNYALKNPIHKNLNQEKYSPQSCSQHNILSPSLYTQNMKERETWLIQVLKDVRKRRKCSQEKRLGDFSSNDPYKTEASWHGLS